MHLFLQVTSLEKCAENYKFREMCRKKKKKKMKKCKKKKKTCMHLFIVAQWIQCEFSLTSIYITRWDKKETSISQPSGLPTLAPSCNSGPCSRITSKRTQMLISQGLTNHSLIPSWPLWLPLFSQPLTVFPLIETWSVCESALGQITPANLVLCSVFVSFFSSTYTVLGEISQAYLVI